jgi:hypothetical protein
VSGSTARIRARLCAKYDGDMLIAAALEQALKENYAAAKFSELQVRTGG